VISTDVNRKQEHLRVLPIFNPTNPVRDDVRVLVVALK
jgi:hypothetical protein